MISQKNKKEVGLLLKNKLITPVKMVVNLILEMNGNQLLLQILIKIEVYLMKYLTSNNKDRL
jgi:hypothetical protein